MCPEDTNGKINGPPIEVKCKTDTGSGANVIPIYVSGSCVQQCLIPVEKH